MHSIDVQIKIGPEHWPKLDVIAMPRGEIAAAFVYYLIRTGRAQPGWIAVCPYPFCLAVYFPYGGQDHRMIAFLEEPPSW